MQNEKDFTIATIRSVHDHESKNKPFGFFLKQMYFFWFLPTYNSTRKWNCRKWNRSLPEMERTMLKGNYEEIHSEKQKFFFGILTNEHDQWLNDYLLWQLTLNVKSKSDHENYTNQNTYTRSTWPWRLHS